jgi:hypothetical protein
MMPKPPHLCANSHKAFITFPPCPKLMQTETAPHRVE